MKAGALLRLTTHPELPSGQPPPEEQQEPVCPD